MKSSILVKIIMIHIKISHFAKKTRAFALKLGVHPSNSKFHFFSIISYFCSPIPCLYQLQMTIDPPFAYVETIWAPFLKPGGKNLRKTGLRLWPTIFEGVKNAC